MVGSSGGGLCPSGAIEDMGSPSYDVSVLVEALFTIDVDHGDSVGCTAVECWELGCLTFGSGYLAYKAVDLWALATHCTVEEEGSSGWYSCSPVVAGWTVLSAAGCMSFSNGVGAVGVVSVDSGSLAMTSCGPVSPV